MFANTRADFLAATGSCKFEGTSVPIRQALDSRGEGTPASKKGLKEHRRSTHLPKNLLLAKINAQWQG